MNIVSDLGTLTSTESTAICCIIRTALSGAVKVPDVTWAISANVGWRLPEVNIGIVCANAPVLRPLYLFYRGRLASQKPTSYAGDLNDKMLPRGATRVRNPFLGEKKESGLPIMTLIITHLCRWVIII